MSYIKMTDTFGKLVGICAGHGGVYAPAQPNLQVAAMSARFTQAQAVLNTVLAARQDLADAITARQAAYNRAAATVVRIRPLVKNLGIPAEVSRKMVRAINRFVLSNSYVTPSTSSASAGSASAGSVNASSETDSSADVAAEARVDSNRSYQTGFLPRLAEFQALVEMLKNCPQYQPATVDLSVAGLTATANNLMVLTMSVHDARNRFNAARAERHTVFHDPATGVLATGKAAKAILQSILGRNGVSGKEISTVKF